MRSLMKNKRGEIGIIIFFFAIFIVIILGFIGAITIGIIDIASDELTPIMEDLGMVGDTNVSEAAGYTFGTVDKVVQALPWILGFSYVMALIFTLVFVIVVGYNPHPAFMGFYIALMLLLIFGAVIMSNMYQDIYTGTDELALRLQEQTLVSYMLLHSPFILTLIAVIGGIIMFSRISTATGGGFGV